MPTFHAIPDIVSLVMNFVPDEDLLPLRLVSQTWKGSVEANIIATLGDDKAFRKKDLITEHNQSIDTGDVRFQNYKAILEPLLLATVTAVLPLFSAMADPQITDIGFAVVCVLYIPYLVSMVAMTVDSLEYRHSLSLVVAVCCYAFLYVPLANTMLTTILATSAWALYLWFGVRKNLLAVIQHHQQYVIEEELSGDREATQPAAATLSNPVTVVTPAEDAFGPFFASWKPITIRFLATLHWSEFWLQLRRQYATPPTHWVLHRLVVRQNDRRRRSLCIPSGATIETIG